MNQPHDPWSNPRLRSPRSSPRREWRAGRSRVILALAVTGLAWVGYTLIAGEHGVLALIDLDRQEEVLKEEIARTEAGIDTLRDKLANLDRTLEEIARVEEGYIGPNEEVYEIREGDSSLVRRDGIDPFPSSGAEAGGPEADGP